MKAPISGGISRLRPHHKAHVPRKPLPLYSSPLDLEKTNSNLQTLSHKASTAVDSKTNDQPEAVSTSNSISDVPTTSHASTHAVAFKPRHESTAIELFYDLFFVANLSVFTENNEIGDADSLASYLGFFTILWFTWLQVSLFDVRFATNSIFDRFSKIVALFVMGTYAFAGPLYNTSQTQFDYIGFRITCYALISQRGMLVFQYGLVIWQIRKYGRAVVLPLALTMIVLFISGIILIGVIFTFTLSSPSHGYIAFYVLSGFEAISVIGISCYWRTISFKTTNLVERVGLLTLIILGEGVIGVTRAIATSLLNIYNTTYTMVALAFGALILLHELWILYFDQIEHDRFGTIRQQIWTLLHFPLHMGLVLAMQGNSRFVILKIGIDAFNVAVRPAFDNFNTNVIAAFPSSHAFADGIRHNLTIFNEYFQHASFDDFYDYNVNLTYIEGLNFNSTTDQNRAFGLYEQMSYAAILFLFDVLDIEIPDTEEVRNVLDLEQEGLNEFNVTYLYYLIGSGFILVLLGIMFWIGKRNKSVFEYVSCGLRIVAGTVLTLLGCTYAGSHNIAFSIYDHNWTIGMVLLIYAIVILFDDLLIWMGYRTYQKTKDSGRWENSPQNEPEDALGHHASEDVNIQRVG